MLSIPQTLNTLALDRIISSESTTLGRNNNNSDVNNININNNTYSNNNLNNNNLNNNVSKTTSNSNAGTQLVVKEVQEPEIDLFQDMKPAIIAQPRLVVPVADAAESITSRHSAEASRKVHDVLSFDPREYDESRMGGNLDELRDIDETETSKDDWNDGSALLVPSDPAVQKKKKNANIASKIAVAFDDF